MAQSELIAAYAGWYIGKPSFINWQDQFGNTHPLPCTGQISGDDSIGPMLYMTTYLPVSYTQPTVTNIHAHHCAEREPPIPEGVPACSPDLDDVTGTATVFYNDVSAFLQTRGLTANYVVFGETNVVNNPDVVSPSDCGNYSRSMADQNVAGFRLSSLKGRSNTTLRAWWLANPVLNNCTVFPNAWNPPYNPSNP